MGLKFKVESLDDVEETQRALYVESKDGGFQLAVEGIDDAAELKRAKQHEVEARKAAEKKLKELQDAQIAKEEEARVAREKAAKAAGDMTALEASWKEKMDRELAALREQYEPTVQSLAGDVERLLVDNVAQRIAGEIALPGSEQVLLPHIRSRLRVDVRDGKRTTVVVDDKGQPSALTLDDLRTEFAANKVFAPIIVGSKASGGGASGAGGGGGATTPKRSQMDTKARSEYISKHGKDAYLKLPA